MSSNKKIKEAMVKKYGAKCMIEEAGIRYIPVEQRRKITGYKKSDEVLTYHHLKPKCKGGQATEENGAIIKGYNHRWLESLERRTRETINNRLREYKAQVCCAEIDGNMHIGNQIMMNFDDMSEFIEIPVYKNVERKEMER